MDAEGTEISARIADLKRAIRAEPADPAHRIALFQLLCLIGDWKGAGTQLDVAQGVDTERVLFAQVYRKALVCEIERESIFRGQSTPTLLGEPEEWIGFLVRALQLAAANNWDQARALQEQAFQAAPGSEGTIDSHSFAWLADGDSRLGPILEAFVDGQYRWIPFSHIKEITIAKPQHIIDAVWATVKLTWRNSGATTALVPVRYPGSESSADDGIRRSQKTEWQQKSAEYYIGLGQRIFVTDEADYPILDVREIVFAANSGPVSNPAT